MYHANLEDVKTVIYSTSSFLFNSGNIKLDLDHLLIVTTVWQSIWLHAVSDSWKRKYM